MKPVIGINGDIARREDAGRERSGDELRHAYEDAVERVGGIPVSLPSVTEPGLIADQLARVNGVILVGGPDYDPALYGAKPHPKNSLQDPLRAAHHLKLADAAVQRRLPVLAICGGMQLVNIVLGGSLEQHLPDLPTVTTQHHGQPDVLAHDVSIEPDSRLAAIVGATTLAVNSSHHQAIARLGRCLRVTAHSTDGVIEAMESERPGDFLLCVQWHPERLTQHPQHLALFEALVHAAGKGQPTD